MGDEAPGVNQFYHHTEDNNVWVNILWVCSSIKTRPPAHLLPIRTVEYRRQQTRYHIQSQLKGHYATEKEKIILV
jgi:hypothetical protein